jgi:branched-subunit amino acid aminotransferase/4-amino-4-deoxychorismate lyase
MPRLSTYLTDHLPISYKTNRTMNPASEPTAYLNGRFLPFSQSALPLHDAGLAFGATVTDMCRTFRHKLFRLEDHLQRFQESCSLAHVPMRHSTAELTGVAERLVGENCKEIGLENDLALVMFATPGPIPHYSGKPGEKHETSPTLGMHTFPLPLHRHRQLFLEGALLVVPATRQLPATCINPAIKHRSRLHWWQAEQEVREMDSGASALLLDEDGFVTETAAANFLIVRDETLVTPQPGKVLNGVSFRVTAEIAAGIGLGVEHRDLTLVECLEADEALLCGTTFCLAGVSKIDGKLLRWPGPVYKKLLSGWNKLVGTDIAGQILRSC